MSGLRLFWVMASACLLLPGCAAHKPRLVTPEIRVVELSMAAPGQPTAQAYDLTLRIHNTSEIALQVQSFSFELLLDGQTAGSHSPSVDLTIPALSNEIVRVSGQLDAGQAQALVMIQNGRRGQIPYSLQGALSSNSRNFKLSYEGWLSRLPGIAGSFR